MGPVLFSVTVVPEPSRVRVAVSGDLDLATMPALTGELDTLLHAGFPDVVVDLARVEFVDSTGLRGLLRSGQRALACGARFEVVGGGLAVRRALEVTGLDAVAPFGR